eukprot:scaffold13.g206.t1
MDERIKSLRALKVADLKEELGKRSLDTKGIKASADELVKRLAEALEAAEGEVAATEAPKEPEVAAAAEAAAEPAPEAAEQAATAGAAEAAEQAATAGAAEAAGAAAAEAAAAPAEPAAGAAAEPAPAGGVTLTQAEKMRLRAERFGLPVKAGEEGAPSIGGLGKFDVVEELERRKKRAGRFGLPIPVTKEEENIKKKQRAQRFGIETKEIVEEKKKARAERFGVGAALGAKPAAGAAVSDEHKRKLEERAKRFGAAA